MAQEIRETIDIIEVFKKNEYMSKIYLHVNMCSEADNTKQLVPFLEKMEQVKEIYSILDLSIE